MKLAPGELARLAIELGARAELDQKRDIQLAASAFGRRIRGLFVQRDEEV